MKLSILVPTLTNRTKILSFLLSSLTKQVKDNHLQNDVEIIVFKDAGQLTTGAKRQRLLNSARGEFIVFIDDDDLVVSDYCKVIVDILNNNEVDYIGYKVHLYFNGELAKPVFHSIAFPKYTQDDHGYYRQITHINPIRREIAIDFPFPDVYQGEDSEWGKSIFESRYVKREYYLDRFMYCYMHVEDKNDISDDNTIYDLHEFDRNLVINLNNQYEL
jgi:glycosyltransferase involved in cell wall biosynthesis